MCGLDVCDFLLKWNSVELCVNACWLLLALKSDSYARYCSTPVYEMVFDLLSHSVNQTSYVLHAHFCKKCVKL